MTACQNSLKILSLNIQSVNSKKGSLWELLNDQDPNIFRLHVSWLNPDIQVDSEIIPLSYKVCRHGRTDGYGGVLIAVKLNIQFDKIKSPSCLDVCTTVYHYS